mmetsp:Transcript_45079/g.70516  ORF Transcript_45079/g.70516 Transcript_45079/m.70516 type:complete len:572 (-) Transcript_45079:640-2355(-)
MGGGASRRYMEGKNPERYFEENVVPMMSDIWEVLEIEREQAKKLFQLYIEIDDDNSGEVSLGELHAFLSMNQTKFTQRVFEIIDQDGSGNLDLKEFCIGVWNYCTYDIRLVSKLAFDIFDVDKIGQLELCECDALLRMMWNPKNEMADPVLLGRIEEFADAEAEDTAKDAYKEKVISFEKFVEAIERYESIIQPALDLQHAMRKKFLGVKYWETKTQRRAEMFAEFDAGHDSWEAINEILAKKRKEREKAEEAAAAAAEREEAERDLDFQREMAAHHRDRQAARKRKLQALRGARAEAEGREDRALAKLGEAQARLELDYAPAELGQRRKWRAHLWEAFAKAQGYAEAALAEAEERERATAVGADALAKAQAELESEEGRRRFEFDVKARYGKLLHEKWAHGNPLQQAGAGAFSSSGGEVTVGTRLALRFARARGLDRARELARRAVEDRHRAQEERRVARRFRDRREDKRQMFEDLRTELVEAFGTKDTKWEKLHDEERDASYWYHIEDKKQLWEEPAICENCDSFIDPMDPKCFECDTERSAYNMGLYKGGAEMNKWKGQKVVTPPQSS